MVFFSQMTVVFSKQQASRLPFLGSSSYSRIRLARPSNVRERLGSFD